MVTQSTTVDYSSGLYICLISLHGLIRGANLELGKNPDTGGQTKYVVDLAKALSNNTNVAHVDLITRKIIDPNFDADYAQTVEPLNDKANIVRIE